MKLEEIQELPERLLSTQEKLYSIPLLQSYQVNQSLEQLDHKTFEVAASFFGLVFWNLFHYLSFYSVI